MMLLDKAVVIDQLRRSVEEDFLHHDYECHYGWLRSVVVSKLNAQASTREVLMFLGPARIGKTRILESLDLEFGKARQEKEGRRKDLVYVRVPEGGTAGSILGAILRAMGEPYQAASKLDELRNRVRQRLLSTGVKVAIFDETQHTVDEGRKTAIRAASDFLKGLIEDNPHVTFIFSGIPIAAQLREQNPQLRGRCDKPVYFLPYNWCDESQRDYFGGAVYTVYEVVAGVMGERAPDHMRFIHACYLLGGGCFGFVINFMRSLANVFEQDIDAQVLKQKHLALAFEKNARDTEYGLNPFENHEPIPVQMLAQAWHLVMNEHGLERFISASTLVGAHA